MRTKNKKWLLSRLNNISVKALEIKNILVFLGMLGILSFIALIWFYPSQVRVNNIIESTACGLFSSNFTHLEKIRYYRLQKFVYQNQNLPTEELQKLANKYCNDLILNDTKNVISIANSTPCWNTPLRFEILGYAQQVYTKLYNTTSMEEIDHLVNGYCNIILGAVR
jgi:hypothetical protein